MCDSLLELISHKDKDEKDEKDETDEKDEKDERDEREEKNEAAALMHSQSSLVLFLTGCRCINGEGQGGGRRG